MYDDAKVFVATLKNAIRIERECGVPERSRQMGSWLHAVAAHIVFLDSRANAALFWPKFDYAVGYQFPNDPEQGPGQVAQALHEAIIEYLPISDGDAELQFSGHRDIWRVFDGAIDAYVGYQLLKKTVLGMDSKLLETYLTEEPVVRALTHHWERFAKLPPSKDLLLRYRERDQSFPYINGTTLPWAGFAYLKVRFSSQLTVAQAIAAKLKPIDATDGATDIPPSSIPAIVGELDNP